MDFLLGVLAHASPPALSDTLPPVLHALTTLCESTTPAEEVQAGEQQQVNRLACVAMLRAVSTPDAALLRGALLECPHVEIHRGLTTLLLQAVRGAEPRLEEGTSDAVRDFLGILLTLLYEVASQSRRCPGYGRSYLVLLQVRAGL